MNNIYVDQRWLDLLVPSCESVGVLERFESKRGLLESSRAQAHG